MGSLGFWKTPLGPAKTMDAGALTTAVPLPELVAALNPLSPSSKTSTVNEYAPVSPEPGLTLGTTPGDWNSSVLVMTR